ncbi:MAG: hypothetical protein HYR83_03735 [Planctomycetes bacterium]|nr:hypothetical protein [Planctomycetota bacterium]
MLWRLTAQRETGRLQSCDEDLEAEMFECTVEVLAAAGFHQYEISNFAKPGCECRHNLLYWRNEPYIGIGPSAAGCIHNRRYKNVSDIGGYVRMIGASGLAEIESEAIDRETLIHELVLMQLRLNEGLDLRLFRERTGVDPRELFAEPLGQLSSSGLIEWDDAAIRLTRRGRLLANHVMAELVAGSAVSGDVALPVIAA